MEPLLQEVRKDGAYETLYAAVEQGQCPVLLTGVGGVFTALYTAALGRAAGRPACIVCADEGEARQMAADLAALTGERVTSLVARDFTFYNAEVVSRGLEQQRLSALFALGSAAARLTVATVDGLMQRTLPPEKLLATALMLEVGAAYDLNQVLYQLTAAGYQRADQVEGPGQFALRGGILDVFTPAYENPVRCEFFGDEIDAMGFFDVERQRRIENIERAEILPAAEVLPGLAPGGTAGLLEAIGGLRSRLEKKKRLAPGRLENIDQDTARLEANLNFPAADKYIQLIYPDFACGLDYLPPETLVVLSQPLRLKQRGENFAWQMGEDLKTLAQAGVLDLDQGAFFADWAGFCAKASDFALVMADVFPASGYPYHPRQLITANVRQIPSYGGSLEAAATDMGRYLREGERVLVLAADQARADSLYNYLMNHGFPAALAPRGQLPPPGTCHVALGSLSGGMEFPGLGLAVLPEGQQAQRRRRTRRQKASGRAAIRSYADLSVGDLVVHEYHGIGRFEGIFSMPVDGVEKDYIKIAYAGTDHLYVPATQLDLVSKYIGGGEEAPVRLSKIGGADWQRAKSRAKGAAKELAEELIQLYAQRQKEKGYAFSPDSEWQREFESRFPYEETEDQLRCIQEIKQDMERPVPMDRLLCGDVGYGKTEVALRAVMKCVLDGKQAAILVPTTVLAQQHYATVSQRFAGYPVTVEVLSRFRKPAQMKKAVAGIRDGSVDIVIGTHRLFQKDIQFKDLGLLIVDEEQRFGVSHKERLKELARQVDVLTLSATPIPRTLNMALSGIRDMSTIEEPPSDRHPVQTYVLEHDWSVLSDAIRRELARGGQVYYLHNRTETIERTAAKIAAMFPDADVAVAHGKMSEEELAPVMEALVAGEVQILVCTTIIETGIDVPNVNTLIIEDADRLGLAQLHQIRGRVGRSARRAFAYLTFRKGKVLTETAAKRLAAIREFAAFNSGFKIAMRDLEIRGAGNLLGAEQSGHMMSVGYDMYLKLLEEAVLEAKGEKAPVRTVCSADLVVNANIPERYVPSGEQRMDLYRRIAAVRSQADADDLMDEIIDRYGEPPRPVIALIRVALLRGEASQAGILELAQKRGALQVTLAEFDMEAFTALCQMPLYKGRLRALAGDVPALALTIRDPKRVLDEAEGFVKNYAEKMNKG